MAQKQLKHPTNVASFTVAHGLAAMDALRVAGTVPWEAFFCGMSWPEGAHYCMDRAFLESPGGVPALIRNDTRAMWFLYNRFVEYPLV